MTTEQLIQLAGPAATTLAALVAAGVAATFGYFQYRNAVRQTKIANDQIALALFDKRYAAYKDIADVFGSIMRSGHFSNATDFALCSALQRIAFLFGLEVTKKLESLRLTMIDLEALNTEMNMSPPSPNHADVVHRRTEKFKEINNESLRLIDLFEPYIATRHRFSP